jgi:hypothetical protein
MNKKDSIKNYYDVIGSGIKTQPKDKNFKKHYIITPARICVLGQSGAGKSNAVINLISRFGPIFYKMVIFSGSTSDEPLYNYLRENIEGVEMYNNIAEVPELKESEEDNKNHQKLIIFDDFITLNKKELNKIFEYAIASRKFGWTCIFLSQNYTSIPKIITRNCDYYIMFRLNDNVSINNIMKNHNIDNIDKETFKKCYVDATSKPMDFFLIDLKGEPKTRLRHNFLDFYDLTI